MGHPSILAQDTKAGFLALLGMESEERQEQQTKAAQPGGLCLLR
jgi:hypothetical protein